MTAPSPNSPLPESGGGAVSQEPGEAWRVIVDDGTVHYFTSKFEAEFFAKDTFEAGFGVRTSPVPLPNTVRDFVAFLEGQETDRRHDAATLAQIEKITPNWRAFRSLAEAVEVAIHHSQTRSAS